MELVLRHLKPTYMEEAELHPSDIYLREEVVFAPAKRYLILLSRVGERPPF